MSGARFRAVPLLIGLAVAALSSGGQTSQSVQAIPAVPTPAYADSTSGLQAQFVDILNAARSKDEAALTTAIDSLRIPNPDQWIAAHFEPRLVPQLVQNYGQAASTFQSHVRWVMENFAKFDDFALQIGPFGAAEPQLAPGSEWLPHRPIDARNCRFTSTAQDPKHGPPSWVSSFVYIDGRFRFVGGTYPFWAPVGPVAPVSPATAVPVAENSVASQNNPTLPTVTSFECPKYPPIAESARVSGMIQMQVTTDGHGVTDVKVTSGRPLLVPAAVQNVRTWKFADHPPITLNVTYSYVLESAKRDPITKCSAKMELPTRVTVYP